MGGRCCQCGWSGSLAAFTFHHKDDNKDFTIGSAANKSWDVIKREIQKCTLLCMNCHTVTHSDYENPKLVSYALRYRGRLLD